MNRSVIVVKAPKEKSPIRWIAVRLHWECGESVREWLRNEYDSHDKAVSLIFQGHRSDRNTPHGENKFWGFNTLAEAKAHCEYYTLAIHNGKGWGFEGK